MNLNNLVKEAKEMIENQEVDLEALQIEMEEKADGVERDLREGKRLEDVYLRPTDDPMVRRIINTVFGDMVECLKEASETRVRGVGAKYRTILRALDPELLAGTTIAHSLDSLMQKDSVNNTVQRLASKIGHGIVTEVKLAQAEELNPLYIKNVDSGLKRKRAGSKRYIRAVYDAAFEAITLGKLEYNLSASDFIQIGKFGLDAMLKAGLIVHEHILANGRKWSIYNIDPNIYEYITAVRPEIHRRALSGSFRYMVVKPDRWEGISGGGFKSERRKINNQLVTLRGLTKELYEDYRDAFKAPESQGILDFANYVQEIPYQIDRDVVELLSKVWSSGGGILGIPDGNDPIEPEFPLPEDWDKEKATDEEIEIFTAWKYEKSKWHETILERRQKTRELYAFFNAVNNQLTDRIYFPVFYDFRGRLYYNANPSPQGSDVARACLQFADKKELGEDGLFWLKVHIANSLGYDETRFEDRARYVEGLIPQLREAVEDPIAHSDAFGDENPLTAYVATRELLKAIDSGSPETYATGIPVHMDATVSGTQHFSAMLRDSVGAEYTNLIDLGQPKKADMYTRVSDKALELMQEEYDTLDEERKRSADLWIEHGIPRDLAKRPVMTYTYGVTKHTVNEYIQGYLSTATAQRYQDAGYSAKDIIYLTNKLFEAIALTIPATVKGMDYLQDIAREVGESAMRWRTPAGFWVHFNVLKQDSRRIAVRSAGVDLVWIRESLQETSKRRMVSGVAPNFVHGCDSSHMTLVGLAAQQEGIQMACIHDSFGTHPSDVTRLHEIIREQFVEMYREDVLGKFRDEVGSTVDSAEYGDFDLSNVLGSEFFFC